MKQPFLVAGLILLGLSGCYRWQNTSLEVQRRNARPEKLRLDLRDGQRVIVEAGMVTADSVIGASSAVSSDRVSGLSARRLDPAITMFLGLGILVPAVVIVAVTTTSTCGAGAAPSC